MKYKLDGMSGILVHLSLKHQGDWMAEYTSLQMREKITSEDLANSIAKLEKNGAEYISLLEENYPENLKSIYKPPFGVYAKGSMELVEASSAVKNTITVIGDYKEAIDTLGKDTNLLWVNKSEKEMSEIMKLHPTGNIFYISQIKDIEKLPKLENGNIVISEIFEKGIGRDYSFQNEARVYLGITKKVFVSEKVDKNELLNVKEYSKAEDIYFVNAKNKEKAKAFEMGA